MPIIAIILVLVLGVGAALFYSNNKTEPVVTTPTPTPTERVPSNNPINTDPVVTQRSAEDGYTDGTYTESGTYMSPAGKEEVNVSLTLKDGVVTDATFDGLAKNQASIKNQKSFADGFKAEVIGKPINQISLTIVNGSSLTSIGFMDALEKIKADARG